MTTVDRASATAAPSTPIPDRYPTRSGAGDTLLQRADPTVWSMTSAGPMSPQQLADHAADGYTIVPNLLSAAELATYRAELDRLTSDTQLRGDQRVVTEPGSGAVRSIFEVHRISAAIATLAADPRILARARQLLGSDVAIHQSRVNTMPGFAGTGFYWHSDFETWHAEDGMPTPRAVSCSIALTDNYPYNGGLMVLPGSQQTYVSCGGRTPAEHYRSSLQAQQVGVPEPDTVTTLVDECGIDQFTGEAGSVLFFDANLMHASGNNITPYPRANIFLVFNSVHNQLTDPFAAAQPRPEFIANREPNA